MITFCFLAALCMGETSLNLGLYTDHIGVNGLNEDSNLIGLSVGDYEIGTYNNSYNTRSYYGAKRFSLSGNDKFGVMGGLVSGYSVPCVQNKGGCREEDILPLFASYYRINDYFTALQMADAVMLVFQLEVKNNVH